jgi:hypothetical protein
MIYFDSLIVFNDRKAMKFFIIKLKNTKAVIILVKTLVQICVIEAFGVIL